jgi:hypothetical protein
MNDLFINKFRNNNSIIISNDSNYCDYFNELDKSFNIFKNIDYNEEHYYIETDSNKCVICKNNINYNKNKTKLDYFIKNQNVIHSTIATNLDKYNIENNNIFNYTNAIDIGIYAHYYYHFCNKCFLYGLYYWNLKYKMGYPKNSHEAKRFIYNYNEFVPEIKENTTYDFVKNIQKGKLFVCDMFSVN